MPDLKHLARQIAIETGLDPAIFDKLIQQESGYSPRAVSSVGAQGLTQLMPATARGLGVRDPFDPEQNLRGGARFLKQMLDRYDGDYRLALAAYNAGPGNVDKYGDVPPFEETQTYIRVILGNGSGPKVLRKPMEEPVEDVQGAEAVAKLFRELGERHGQAYEPFPLNPTETLSVGSIRETVPNLSPTYRYLYRDGTYVDVRSVKDPKASPGTEKPVKYEIVAVKEEQPKAQPPQWTPIPTDNKEPFIVGRRQDGQITKDDNPNYKAPAPPKPDPKVIPSDTKEPFIQILGPNGVEKIPNANYVAPKPEKPERFTVGRSVYRENPDGTITRIHEEPRDAPQLQPRHPEQVERDQVEIEKTKLENEQKRREAMGVVTMLHDNHMKLISQLEKMKPGSPGGISVEKATQMLADSYKNLVAGVRGSTVAQEQERMREDRRAKNRLGGELLQQRLQSGSSLAAALTTSAFGSDVMMPAGKSSLGYSPGLLALEMTNELQGGPQVTDFARSMMQAEDQDWMEGAPSMPTPPWETSPPNGGMQAPAIIDPQEKQRLIEAEMAARGAR